MGIPSRSFAAVGFAALLAGACDGSGKQSTTDAAASVASPNGVVVGPLDHHCSEGDGGQRMQSVGACLVDTLSSEPANAASCDVKFTQDAGTSHEPSDAGADNAEPYGQTMFGSAGNDDDCKYYLSWVATPIQQNTDTTFTVTAIRLADGKPATCAGVRPDVFLSTTHGAAPPPDVAPEIAAGVYKVGPIRFDARGRWTVRFHFYESCSDTPEDSPHGHAAFYVDVP
jgi:hypothetical protein